jgi:hypothetical protein
MTIGITALSKFWIFIWQSQTRPPYLRGATHPHSCTSLHSPACSPSTGAMPLWAQLHPYPLATPQSGQPVQWSRPAQVSLVLTYLADY